MRYFKLEIECRRAPSARELLLPKSNYIISHRRFSDLEEAS
jgi:hypothetical protein